MRTMHGLHSIGKDLGLSTVDMRQELVDVGTRKHQIAAVRAVKMHVCCADEKRSQGPRRDNFSSS